MKFESPKEDKNSCNEESIALNGQTMLQRRMRASMLQMQDAGRPKRALGEDFVIDAERTV